MINHISANELDSWADSNPRRAQEILPELIIRLILATSNKINSYNFPIEKGIQYPGYDGVLDSAEQTNFFPKGKSVWECGTDKDIKSKFESDLAKRTENPLGEDKSNTIFIFTTIRIWNHRTSIEEELNTCKENYKWKDIQIFDASKICLWLEKCPAVSCWMLKIMGKSYKDICNIEQYWEEYSISTSPHLKEDFFLLGRDEEKNEVLKWLDNGQGNYILAAESSLEASLFLAACILNSERVKELTNIALVIKTAEAWNEILQTIDTKVLLIPLFEFSEDIRCQNSLFVIAPTSIFSSLSKTTTDINIHKQYKDDYYAALRTLGLPEEKLYQIEQTTKRSFIYLYREITTEINKKQPKWLSNSNVKILIPAIFVGSWNSNCSGDRIVIEKISGQKFDDYMNEIAEWMNIDESPIFKVGNTYHIVSVMHLWMFLFDIIKENDMQVFSDVALDVFGYSDPAYELEKDKRFMADLLDKKSIYSNTIKRGMAITMVILHEKIGESNCCGVQIRISIDTLISDILKSIKTWHQWATIAPYLPIFIEASPTTVINRLKLEFDNDESQIWQLFMSTENSLWSRNEYTYILSAVEELIWYEDCVVHAILLLACINEKGIDYKLSNSPINSLYNIFCLWRNHGCLCIEDKSKLIEILFDKYPNTAWELTDKLLPTTGQMCMSIPKPKWHNFDNKIKSTVTHEEYWYEIDCIVKYSLETIDNKSKKWTIIFDNVDFFENNIDDVIAKCIEQSKTMNDTELFTICNNLRNCIFRKRKYIEKNAISDESVLKLERLYKQILPDSIMRYEYLFKWHPNILNPIPYNSENFDYDEEENHLNSIRKTALDEMLQLYSLDEIIDFCQSAEDVSYLSEILYPHILTDQVDFKPLLKLKERNREIYSHIAFRYFHNLGIDAGCEKLKKSTLSLQQQADIICQNGITHEMFEKLDSLEDEIKMYFWENVYELKIYNLNDNNIVNTVLAELLEHNRCFSAFNLLKFTDAADTALMILILQRCYDSFDIAETCGRSNKIMDAYSVSEVFKKIYESKSIDVYTVFNLEFKYISWIKDIIKPKCLMEVLAQNPSLYVEIISEMYKSDEEIEEDKPHSTKKSDSFIKRLYDLMDCFTDIPGCNENIKEQDIFDCWIKDVQNIAEKAGYSQATELCLGKLLSYAPVGNDGIFPHEIVRTFFEKNASEDLIREFMISKYNQRGVHAMTEGRAEKNIADAYYSDSKALRISYPNTAQILNRMAKDYEYDSLHDRNFELRF